MNKRFFNFDRVLCLSPHPDDVEYSMAATIVQHPDTEFDVYLLTQGTPVDNTTGVGRVAECYAFWSDLIASGVDNVTFQAVPELLQDANIPRILTALETALPARDYQAIVGPPMLDSHIEHQTTNRMMAAYARHHALSVLEYCTSSTLPGWVPNVRVVLDPHVKEKKINAIRKAFVSQLDGRYFDQDVLEAFHSDFVTLKRNVAACEKFRVDTLYWRSDA